MSNQKDMLETLIDKINLNNQISYCILMSNIIAHSDINSDDKQLLLLLLQSRDRNYIRINHNDICYQNIKTYLNLIRPLDIPLNELVRIGGSDDGGYILKNDLRSNSNDMGGGGLI